MPEGLPRSHSPVVPEPGRMLELPEENVKGTHVKIQNARCDRKNFRGGPLELVPLKIPPGDFSIYPGWNLTDRIVVAEVKSHKVGEVSGFGNERSFTRGMPLHQVEGWTRGEEMGTTNADCSS